MFKSLLAAGALALSLSAPVAAQNLIDYSDLDTFEDLLSGYGSVERDLDNEDIILFNGRMNGLKYQLYFYDCDGTKDCSTGLFVAYFDGTQYNTDLALINEFNNQVRFGRVSIDGDGDIEANMAFTFLGGATRTQIDDTFAWWQAVLSQVNDFFE